MKGGWKWWLVLFAGTLPIGNGLQYFVTGEAARNTGLRNGLVVGQIVFGLMIIGYALVKIIRSGHAQPKADVEEFRITED